VIKIIPAILPHSYKGIEIPVERILGAATTVQIDIVDGHFAPSRTWLFNHKDEETISAIFDQEVGMPYWQELNYELDLMVKITFHLEGLDPEITLAYFQEMPEIIRAAISFGMAINIDTDPAGIAPYIPFIESIQCMGIKNVGYQGQQFDEEVYEQIKKVKALYPDKSIAVDGGVSLENAAQLVEAGATELIIGSALFQNNDSRGTIEAFEEVCTKILHSGTSQSEN
jgi:ribulose-phosphate 3-epimerase